MQRDVDHGAPRPACRSETSTVRKSTLKRALPDVFGMEACSCVPENNMTAPGGGTTMSVDGGVVAAPLAVPAAPRGLRSGIQTSGVDLVVVEPG